MTGTVFHIQKFSLNDGPGIRTVVFLKGCPLRCRWCSNPESQQPEPETLGHGMGLPAESQRKTVEEVVDTCLQDWDFYQESGGGVTLSGGEPTAQPEFCLALLEALKIQKLHTAIETTGYLTAESFKRLLPYVDLFLYDVKHWDCEKHQAGTGVSNTWVLENLRQAVSNGKEVLPRLPVIPGFNDSLEDTAGFSELLKRLGLTRIQLLPFHQFGEKKYELLGKTYDLKGIEALHEEDLREYRQAFLDQGIEAFF